MIHSIIFLLIISDLLLFSFVFFQSVSRKLWEGEKCIHFIIKLCVKKKQKKTTTKPMIFCSALFLCVLALVMGSRNTSKVEECSLLAAISCSVVVLFMSLFPMSLCPALWSLIITCTFTYIIYTFCKEWKLLCACFIFSAFPTHLLLAIVGIWQVSWTLDVLQSYSVNDCWSLSSHLDICRARQEHVYCSSFRRKLIPFQTSAEHFWSPFSTTECTSSL